MSERTKETEGVGRWERNNRDRYRCASIQFNRTRRRDRRAARASCIEDATAHVQLHPSRSGAPDITVLRQQNSKVSYTTDGQNAPSLLLSVYQKHVEIEIFVSRFHTDKIKDQVTINNL